MTNLLATTRRGTCLNTPPKLPREHRDHLLAVWSDEAPERRAWHHYEELSELFQMLHRGRQTRAAERRAARPHHVSPVPAVSGQRAGPLYSRKRPDRTALRFVRK